MSYDDVVEVSPAAPVGRRRRDVAIGAVVAVLVVGGCVGAWAATRGGGGGAAGAFAPPSCPTAVADTGVGVTAVPQPPSASGVDDRLVPDRAPTSVVLCEYGGVAVAPAGPAPAAGDATSSLVPVTTGIPSLGAEPQVALGRQASVDGADATVGDLLAALRNAPPAATGGGSCFGNPELAGGHELVGLLYDDGTVWVASGGPCGGSTNGETDSSLALAPLVSAVLDATGSSDGSTGVTVSPVPPDTGTGTDPSPGASDGTLEPGYPTGTPADDPFVACQAPSTSGADVFVPFTPVGVRVCHVAVDPTAPGVTTVDRPTDVAVSLADALDALPTLEPDVACTAIGGETWALLFTAADGTTAVVQVDAGGCGTASNGVRLAQADATLFDALSAAD